MKKEYVMVGVLLAAGNGALAQFGTVYLNNFDSRHGLFEAGGCTPLLADSMVDVVGGPVGGPLAPVVSGISGNPSKYSIRESDRDLFGPGTGSFFHYGSGQVNGVLPGGIAMFRLRVWRGAATYEAALASGSGFVASSATWIQATGNPDFPPTPPATLQLPDVRCLPAFPPRSISVPPQSQTVMASETVTFSVSITNVCQVTLQWYKNLIRLEGATNATLTLTNVGRSNAGTYSVEVFGICGYSDGSTATLRVLMPQRFETPLQLGDGRLRLSFRDQDGSVASLSYATNFVLQASPNLVDWQTASGSLSLTNGFLLFEESAALAAPYRFYRIIEQ